MLLPPRRHHQTTINLHLPPPLQAVARLHAQDHGRSRGGAGDGHRHHHHTTTTTSTSASTSARPPLQALGWVREMWGYCIGAASLGIKHRVLDGFQFEGRPIGNRERRLEWPTPAKEEWGRSAGTTCSTIRTASSTRGRDCRWNCR